MLGTTIGLVTGYFRGLVDDVISRVVDAVLAIPLIVTAILVVTASAPSRWVIVLIIGLVFAPIIARTVRAAVLAESELDYVEAARLRGERSPYIMFAEILPNVLSPIVVEFTVRLGYAIFAIATLRSSASASSRRRRTGRRRSTSTTLIDPYWWTTFFPALAIATLVVAVNLVADGIREVFER